MDRILNSLSGRLILTSVIVNAILAPILFAVITSFVRQSHEEMFIDEVRQLGRITADRLEPRLDSLTDSSIINLLDSVVFQDANFAEFIIAKKHLESSLSGHNISNNFNEDFKFGGNGDATYYISISIGTEDRDAVLRLGFDERPMSTRIQAAQARIALIFFIFIGVSIVILIILTVVITRPLRQLQYASKEIAAGNYQGNISVKSDINEIKKLSDDLQNINDLRMKLLRLQKLETMGTFAGGIAHELNNVLLPMRLYAEMAIEQLSSDSEAKQDIEKLVSGIDRASDLVDKILSFSHQKSPSDHIIIEIYPIIEDALNLIKAVLPPTITLNYEQKTDGLKIVGDESEIHQIIMNLCTNAYKAMSRDGGTLTVEVESIYLDQELIKETPNLTPGRHICMRISDTGEGIDPLTIEHIFEPFFTTRGVGEGVGLGLSVVHGIVMHYKGHISVKSTPNSGACFEVLLSESIDTEKQND